MIFDKLQKQPELVQQELTALADSVPEIVSAGLISVDGMKLGLYSENSYTGSSENEEEGNLGPYGATITALSERVSGPLGAGEWEFSVIAGKRGKIFALVDDDIVLIVIAKPETLVDALLPQLKATCERLNTLSSERVSGLYGRGKRSQDRFK